VRYVLVGGEAVIHYGHTRVTGDIDLYFEQSEPNVTALFQALQEFWHGPVPGIAQAEELLEPNVITQFGRPPNRIDLIGSLKAVRFDEAWSEKFDATLITAKATIAIPIMSLRQLVRTKEAAGRPKDLEDLKFLRKRLEQTAQD
jgi:uncharacterized nucleotidyltransferase DUF6036